ncbi:hypothetical protein CRG98_016796 [Punica granatum]|uniref:Uncharacterized protein n=1 Tax=Punica granatum TaxID=22663 RepID=A0A2I0K2S7_PUNGR|nr:hypothetical protein CRG98_016796 [Punica granatum]
MAQTQWKGSRQSARQWSGGRMMTANVAHELTALGGARNNLSGQSRNGGHTATANAVHEGRVSTSTGGSLTGLSGAQFETLLNMIAAHEGRNESLDFLFVPAFNYNLISVGQLSKDMDCLITFLPELCLIQDRVSKRTVGLGKLQRGGLLPTMGGILGIGLLGIMSWLKRHLA